MPATYEDRILRVLSYIHDNPGGDLSLDRLADEAAMSRFHWHRVFRAMTGETCAQAVRRIRLHRAAILLVQSDTPLEHVAAQCGYPNPASFARAFDAAYGSRPGTFRKAGRLLAPNPDTGPETGDNEMYETTIRNEPRRRLITLPHKGAYHLIGKAFETFFALCQSRELWPKVGGIFSVYLDNPEVTPEADLRSLVGGEWHGQDMPDGMAEQLLEGGKTAVLTYKGPYSGIEAAYQVLYGSWLPASGEEPGDAPGYEIYLNSSRDTAPEELLTEICLPLK
ncbi:MAG: AraC family transcriptional regulator [Rhodobacteraceae bacterium]|nr:AraC family transcriptional regulator [Paracoccaceae bacterium]